MKKESIFFAMPEEQRTWLKGLLQGDDRIWCVEQRPGVSYSPVSLDSIEALDLNAGRENDLKLYLGRTDLSRPVWKVLTAGKTDLDPVASQAIGMFPSLLTRTGVLLLGQIGVASDAWFQDLGIDPAPLNKWFRAVSRSLVAALREPRAVVLCHLPGEAPVQTRGAFASPGAVDHGRSGGLLKQFVDAPLQFAVQVQ